MFILSYHLPTTSRRWTIHRHGPRNRPCPRSDFPSIGAPIAASHCGDTRPPCASASAWPLDTDSNSNLQVSNVKAHMFQSLPPDSTSAVAQPGFFYHPQSGLRTIKNILKPARLALASALVDVLNFSPRSIKSELFEAQTPASASEYFDLYHRIANSVAHDFTPVKKITVMRQRLAVRMDAEAASSIKNARTSPVQDEAAD